jgi:hypothetical protein
MFHDDIKVMGLKSEEIKNLLSFNSWTTFYKFETNHKGSWNNHQSELEKKKPI